MTNKSAASDKVVHSLTAKIFHWGFALVFIYGVIKQINNLNQLRDSALLRFEIVFALIFLLLLALRYIFMRLTQRSALAEDANKYQKLAAKAVHLGMYLSLSLIAISGLFIGGLFSLGFQNGIMINLFVGLHEFSITISYLLISIHVLAAVYHRFKRDGVWDSMVPFWREKSSLE